MLLLVLELSCFAAAESERTRNQAIALGARAVEVSDLRQGKQRFHLHGKFTLFDTLPNAIEGTYDLLWESESAWREQITLPKYTEIRIGRGDRVWVQRPELAVASRLETVRRLLSISKTFKIGPNDRILKVTDSTFDGTRGRCFVRKVSYSDEQTVCFDASSGALLGTVTSWGTKRIYSDFRTDGTKLVAHRILYYENRKLLVEISLEKVSFPTQPDIASFVPVGRVEEFETCQDQTAARIVDHDMPRLPQHIGGTVNIWLILDQNGRITRIVVEDAIPEAYRDTIVATISKWKFEPAKCGKKAVPMEFGIVLDFTRPNPLTLNYPYVR